MLYELIIIGAGLTGIQAAIAAHEVGIKKALIVDYERTVGGFGSSLFQQPEFEIERRMVERVKQLPYDCWTQSTVVGFFEGEYGENHQLTIQTPYGTKEVEATNIILSTGTLEKPRESNQIAGSRPAGVMTPLMALSLLERGLLPGQKIILFNNDQYTETIGRLLEENGATVTKVTKGDYYLIDIRGNSRVNSVTLQHVVTGDKTFIECDTLLFHEGVIPCTFYLKGTSFELDDYHFIVVDDKGRTNIDGVYSFGTCTNKPDKFTHLSEVTLEIIKEQLLAVKGEVR